MNDYKQYMTETQWNSGYCFYCHNGYLYYAGRGTTGGDCRKPSESSASMQEKIDARRSNGYSVIVHESAASYLN